MKRLLVVTLLALAVPGLAFGQAGPRKMTPSASKTAEQEVMALERAWLAAGLKDDVAWYERNLADTMVNTDEEGVVTGKAEMVAEAKNHVNKYETLSYDDLKARAYGDTVIATGIVVVKGTSKGKPVNLRSEWTDTWVKRGGQWQCVASQATKLGEK